MVGLLALKKNRGIHRPAGAQGTVASAFALAVNCCACGFMWIARPHGIDDSAGERLPEMGCFGGFKWKPQGNHNFWEPLNKRLIVCFFLLSSFLVC